MLYAFLPDGADGNGRWLKAELDANFNGSSRQTMIEFLAKSKDATILEYAKTIKQTSMAFQVGWEQVFTANYDMGTQIVPGHMMRKLLEERFMESKLWETLHSRIGEWASRLRKRWKIIQNYG